MSLPSTFHLVGSMQENIRLTGDNPKIVGVLKLQNLLKEFLLRVFQLQNLLKQFSVPVCIFENGVVDPAFQVNPDLDTVRIQSLMITN
jgi:hypothetical protein